MTFRTKLGSHLLYLVLAFIFFTTIQGVGRVSASEIEFKPGTAIKNTTIAKNGITTTQTDVDAAVRALPKSTTSLNDTVNAAGITFNVKDANYISKWDIKVFYRKDWSPSFFNYQELRNFDSNITTYQSGSDYNVNIKNLDWNQSPRYYISIYARGNTANVLYKSEVTQEDEGSTIILQRDLSYTKFQVNIPSAGEGYIIDNIVLNDRDTKICLGSIDNNAYVKQGSYNLQVLAKDNVNNYNLFKTNIEVSGEIMTIEFRPEDMVKINFNFSNNSEMSFAFLYYFPHLEGFNTTYGGDSTDYIGKNLYLSKQKYRSMGVHYRLGTEYILKYDVPVQSEFIFDQDKTIDLDTNLRLMLNLDSQTYSAGQSVYNEMGGIYDGFGNKVGISDNNYQSVKGRLEFRKGTEVYNVDVNNLSYPSIILPNTTGEFDVTFSLVDSPIAIAPVTTKIRIGTSTDIPVTSVTLDKSSVTMMAGSTEQLTAQVDPSNSTNQDIIWSVISQSTDNVITVSDEGLVTAVNPGTAVIRATSNADPTIYAECSVAVTAGLETVLIATPIVQIGINPNAADSAGIFIGLKDIRDTQGNLVPDAKLAGYQINFNYDQDQVTVLDLVDEAHLGNFTFNNTPNATKASVVDVVYDGTSNFEKLFFVPIALTGTSNNTTDVTIKFTSLSDTNWNDISIPDVTLTFQRGKIANEASQSSPSIVDAVAGLQYLAERVDAGLDPGKVNVVNMASILQPEVGTTSIKPSVKGVIALMQYLVELRDDHFMLVNQPAIPVNFGYGRRAGTTSGKQIEVYGLMDGDIVTLLKGSDPTQMLDSPKQAVSGPEPKVVFDNVNFGNELYLNLHVERSTSSGVQTGNRTIFENLKVSTGVIRNGQNNTRDTDVMVSGLRNGDKVSLYKWGTDEQIQSTHTVNINGDKEVFYGVAVIEEGIRVQIERTGVSISELMHHKWGDLITYSVETQWGNQWETVGSYQASITGLVANDLVKLYSGTILLKENTADGLFPVVLDGLNPKNTALQFKVIRNGFESHMWYLTPPPLVPPTVNFGYGSKSYSDGTTQIIIYGLRQGDQVDVLKGSNNTSMLPQPVLSTSSDPVTIDNIIIGSELYLRVRVTREDAVGEAQVFNQHLKVSMGVINSSASGSSTDIIVNGLQAGDTVRLYQGGNVPSVRTLSVEGINSSVIFDNVNMTNESGVKVQISRQNPASTTPIIYYSWERLVLFSTSTSMTNGLETLTVSGLLTGDILNLYDSQAIQIDGQQNLVPGIDGNIVITGLSPDLYKIEVVRGNIHSWVKANVPSPL